MYLTCQQYFEKNIVISITTSIKLLRSLIIIMCPLYLELIPTTQLRSVTNLTCGIPRGPFEGECMNIKIFLF